MTNTTLDGVDWDTITVAQATRLRAAAHQHVKALGRLYEAGVITEPDFLRAVQQEEDLHIFVVCGEKPSTINKENDVAR
jgi:hypothetical protein